MTFDQEPPDEQDYRMISEGDQSDEAFESFTAGYDATNAPLTSEERDVAASAWAAAWALGAGFEREWRAAHHSTVSEEER